MISRRASLLRLVAFLVGAAGSLAFAIVAGSAVIAAWEVCVRSPAWH